MEQTKITPPTWASYQRASAIIFGAHRTDRARLHRLIHYSVMGRGFDALEASCASIQAGELGTATPEITAWRCEVIRAAAMV